MYRLSLIISEVFNKYLPLADQAKVQLNLDFSDTTQQVAHPEAVKHDLDQQLSSALQHTVGGEISVAVTDHAITITDAATVLSPAACALLSNRRVTVKSRTGFGTTITIQLSTPNRTESPASTGPQPVPKSQSRSRSTPDKTL